MYKCSWCWAHSKTLDDMVTSWVGETKVYLHPACFTKWRYRGKEVPQPTVDRKKGKK